MYQSLLRIWQQKEQHNIRQEVLVLCLSPHCKRPLTLIIGKHTVWHAAAPVWPWRVTSSVLFTVWINAIVLLVILTFSSLALIRQLRLLSHRRRRCWLITKTRQTNETFIFTCNCNRESNQSWELIKIRGKAAHRFGPARGGKQYNDVTPLTSFIVFKWITAWPH